MTVDKLRLALPSKGAMMDPTQEFLRSSGLRVMRPNPRQYKASIRSLPGAEVIFQRVADIYRQVNAGNVDAGIMGLDEYAEQRKAGDNTVLIMDDLGYSRCEVLLGVPDSWVGVENMADLGRLAAERHDEGRQLRIATHYPSLVTAFCESHGVRDFVLETQYEGTLEMAPAMGTADLVADISETGTTMKENHLKPLEGGVILRSTACLIGNRKTLVGDDKLRTARSILELLEASLRAEGYYYLIANVAGASADSVAALIIERPELAGTTGPTISPVYPKAGGGPWYDVTIIVDHEHLVTAIGHLREIGATGINAIPTKYVFEDRCRAYERLIQATTSQPLQLQPAGR